MYYRSYLYEDAKQEKDRFREAMIEWQTNIPEKHRVNVDFQNQNTWKEVVDLLEKAKTNYEDPTGKWGSMRKCFRKLTTKVGTSAPLLDGWMGLLPSQSEYASVICGGIKLIIGVYHPLAWVCGMLRSYPRLLPV